MRPRRARYGDRDWTHPSVHALMEGVSNLESPINVVTRYAREIVDEARPYGWTGPPFDPLVLIDLQGIRARPATVNMEQDAMIVPLDGGEDLEIIWNPNSPLTRRNFSLCHEIAHTVFPDCYQLARYRRQRDQRDPDRELEMLCNIAASEMLFPLPEFGADLRKEGFGASAFVALSARYIASLEAVARRAVGLTRQQRAIVVLSLRNKPSELVSDRQTGFTFYQPPPRKLRVDYAVGSASAGSFVLPKHKSAPDGSCVYSAIDRPLGAEEIWPFGGRQQLCTVEALALPRLSDGEEQRVLILLTPSLPIGQTREDSP